MVTAEFDLSFQKAFSKIKDPVMKEKIIKQIAKLKDNPELGKPMRYTRKGTRELYISPSGFRIFTRRIRLLFWIYITRTNSRWENYGEIEHNCC